MAEGDIVVDTQAPEPASAEDTEGPQPPVEETAEDPNLAKKLIRTKAGKERLEEIAKQALEDFDEAWDNSEDYRRQTAENWRLFAGDLKKKDWPFKHAANVHDPILLENSTRIGFRMYAELFGDWNDVCGAAPLGPDDEAAAKLVTLHSNWQLRKQIPDFKRQMMRGIMAYLVAGDVTCDSFWDPVREQNRHEMLTADEFVTPFVTSTMPDYSDCPFTCRILGKFKSDLVHEKMNWVGVDEIIDKSTPTADSDPDRPLMRAMGETLGVEMSDRASPYNFIQYEGWFDIDPLKPAKKKELHWCRATVDYASRAVVDFKLMEEADWQDQARFNSQTQEMQAFQSQTAQFHATVASQQQQMDAIQGHVQQMQLAGQAPPEQIGAVQGALSQAGDIQAQAQPPEPPVWMQSGATEPRPVKMVPLRMKTHFVNIEPPEGNLGLGQGRVLADFNRGANTAASQFTDSATLANCWSVIVAEGVEFDKPFQISPGGVNKATGATGQNIRDSIIEVKPAPANPQLLEVVRFMDEKGQAVMQAPTVLSGEAGKSGETFRGITARIEQATKQLSVPTRRFADGVENVLLNNAKLNAQFLRDEELFHVAEAKGLLPKEMKIGRAMYEKNYHFEIRADLKFTSQTQKVQEADELLALYRSIPQLAQNFCLLWHILEMSLRAREQDKLVGCLGPVPPNPPTLAGFPPPPQAMPGAPPQGPQGVPGVAAPPNIPQPMSKLPAQLPGAA